MEFAKLQKSAEVVFEETLEGLSESFAALATSTTTLSLSLKQMYSADSGSHIKHEKVNQELAKLKEENKPDLVAYRHDTIAECDSLATNIQNLFEHYKVPYEEWCVHEGRIQKTTEEFKSTIDGIVGIHEGLLKKTRKRVEMVNKNVSALGKAATSVPVHSNDEDELSSRHRQQSTACQNYSVACAFLFIPRQIHRFFRYLSSKMHCASPPRQRTASYETLVVQKKTNGVTERSGTKDLKLSKERLQEMTKNLVSSLEDVIRALRDIESGISYIYQDLCRLDYLEANKEKHYEIMSRKYEPVTRNCRTYISSLVTLRSEIAVSLCLNVKRT